MGTKYSSRPCVKEPRRVSAAVQEKDRKKSKAQFTFLEQFAQRLDRALQGHNERDAQVVYAAKPLLQYLSLRIHDYLEPRPAEPVSADNGDVLWDPAELRVPDWLYTERGAQVEVAFSNALMSQTDPGRVAAATPPRIPHP